MEAPEAAVAAGEYPDSAGEEEAYPCKGCGEVSLNCFPGEVKGGIGMVCADLNGVVDSGRGEGF